MEAVESLSESELAGVAAIWIAQKRQLITAFGGTSMLPTIAPGQKVLLFCGVAPQLGDIAAYTLGDRLAVHRVVAAAGDGRWLLTWGDANPFPDDVVDDPNRIVGKVSCAEVDGDMRPVAPARPSLWRKLILRFVVAGGEVATMRRRIAILYRLRARLAQKK